MVVDLENLSNVKTDEVIKFILENISDLVVITNDNFEIEIINDDAHRTITGYDDMDLTGKSLLETIHPKDRKKANGELRKLLKNGLMEGKTRLKCKNGEYIWLKIDGQTFYDTLGKKKIILVGKEFIKHRYFAKSHSTNEDKFKEMLDNLTEIRFWKMLQPKQAVAIYQESQEMLKLIMDNIPQYIAWKDKNLTYLGCNNNFLDLLNIKNEEDLLGKKDFDLKWGEEYALSLYMNDSRVLESNAPEIHRIESWQNQEGVKMWFDINRIPLHDLDGNVVGILVTLENITDRNFAEQQLKESEEMFRTIGEQSLMGMGILQDDVFKYVNKQFAKIYGYTVDEILSWPELEYQKLTHPEDLFFTADQARKKQLGEHDVVNRYQFRGVKKSGDTIWLEIFSKSISFEGNHADLVTLIDVTEKRLAEHNLKDSEEQLRILNKILERRVEERTKELRDSEEKYRLLFENSPNAIVLNDEKGVIIDCNTATEGIFGVSRKKLIGQNYMKTQGASLAYIFKDRYDQLLEHNYLKSKEFQLIRRDGKPVWINFQNSIVKMDNNLFVQSILQDITIRKKAENKLKESEEKFRTITDNSLMGIFITQENEFKYVNDVMSNIYELTNEEIMKWTIREFMNKIHPDDRDYAVERLKKRLVDNSELSPFFSFRIITKSGKVKWVDSSTKPINFKGKLAHLSMILDITDRKEAEEKLKESELKLREQNIELKNLDEIKNDFITMAAHELKTPLISISGYTEYILTKHKERLDEITPEINKDLMIVQRNIKRLQNLMDQLLDVMKIESKKIVLYKHPMNIKKIIDNCIDELSYIINEKNHNLVLDIDEDITLNVDSERFFEIISNLLSNAVKFSPKNGKIEISCNQREDGTYLFKVKDNGIGLKADELGKLFQKFQIIREYSGENYIKGTGIGLFISKGFVEAHGGKIWATSDGHNKGTTFSFTIPY